MPEPPAQGFPPETFILIPGRTAGQGTTLNEGKFTPGYVEETSTLLMCPADMKRLGLANGARVRLRSEQGQIELPCHAAKEGELPPGLLFLPYGINVSGTVYRMDDVPIPLRPAFESPYPGDEQVLRAIEKRVRELQGGRA
jgi:formylmethanofuran dehydrogenase subunit D